MAFDRILHLIITYGYLLIFLLMVVEGPITTVVSAFASALGYFDIYIVFLLALVGNLIPDLIYYALGYWGRTSFIDKHKKIFGFRKAQIANLEKFSIDNAVKSLLVVKLLPFLAMPGLITAGAMKIPFGKYLKWVLIIIFCNSLFFLLVGYYFGSTYKTFERYFDFKLYLVAILLVILGLVIYGYKKIAARMLKTI